MLLASGVQLLLCALALEIGLESLANGEVKHDLLGSCRDRVRPHLSVQPLDLLALAAASVRQTAKDLRRLSRTQLERARRLRLQQRDRSAETRTLLLGRERAELVRNVLEVRVRRLDVTRHVGELLADHRVLDQQLAKGLALERVLDGLLVAHASKACRMHTDGPALVVKVVHDTLHPRHPHKDRFSSE